MRICVPGLFIVPRITISPCSTLSALTTPSNGAMKRHFETLSRAAATVAPARATSSRVVATADNADSWALVA